MAQRDDVRTKLHAIIIEGVLHGRGSSPEVEAARAQLQRMQQRTVGQAQRSSASKQGVAA